MNYLEYINTILINLLQIKIFINYFGIN